MEAQENKPVWHVWGTSVQGASHQRAGKKNQDALGWLNPQKANLSGYVLAVADGHGSPHSSKSDIGSDLAVKVLLELARDYIKEIASTPNTFSLVKQGVEQKLPQDLIREWRKRVDKQEHPDEDGQLSPKQTDYVLYGSTILGVLLTSHYVVYLQLGDGDILTVSQTGEVTRPFARDERLLANQTTSLATTSPTLNTLKGSSSYASDVYVKFELFQNENDPPALILVSTDGYSNSYKDDKAFEQIGPDYLELLKTEGLPVIQENLESWLNETSQTGSGDDITLGLIVWANILPSRDSVSPVTVVDEEAEMAFVQNALVDQEISTPPTSEEVTE